jgi:hypothetical protein
MGEIARQWDQMSEAEKVNELRAPTITRALGKPRGKCDFLKSFEDLVVAVRRKAMGCSGLEERAALVDRTWRDLQVRFRRAGIAPDFQAVVRRCLISETISWPWLGRRIDYPPGEGE